MACEPFEWAGGGGVPGPDGLVPAGCVEGWAGADGRGGGGEDERGEGGSRTAVGVCSFNGLCVACVSAASIDCECWWCTGNGLGIGEG